MHTDIYPCVRARVCVYVCVCMLFMKASMFCGCVFDCMYYIR